MKINPVAVQSYRQVARHDRPAGAEALAHPEQQTGRNVTIPPQQAGAGPRLAVPTPRSDYSEFLTPEERNALEVLFRRFRYDGGGRPVGVKNESLGGDSPPVGGIVDIKV